MVHFLVSTSILNVSSCRFNFRISQTALIFFFYAAGLKRWSAKKTFFNQNSVCLPAECKERWRLAV